MKRKQYIKILLQRYGKDILDFPQVRSQTAYIQHGRVSIYAHCIHVAYVSILLAAFLHLRINRRAVIRGALLHDYCLYDWHIRDASHRWHGFTHAEKALVNADRDFELSPMEKDIIKKHMFPLNPSLPGYRETVLVCIADKICALCEMLSVSLYDAELMAGSRPEEEKKHHTGC